MCVGERVLVKLCKENMRDKNGCNWNRSAVSHIASILQSCRNVLSRYFFLMFMEWCQSQQVTNSAQKLGCLFPDCRSDDLFWILGCLRNLLPTCQVMATFVVLQGIQAMWMCLEGAMSCFEWLSLTWSHMVPWCSMNSSIWFHFLTLYISVCKPSRTFPVFCCQGAFPDETDAG